MGGDAVIEGDATIRANESDEDALLSDCPNKRLGSNDDVDVDFM